jgi:hypothetical protein
MKASAEDDRSHCLKIFSSLSLMARQNKLERSSLQNLEADRLHYKKYFFIVTYGVLK